MKKCSCVMWIPALLCCPWWRNKVGAGVDGQTTCFLRHLLHAPATEAGHPPRGTAPAIALVVMVCGVWAVSTAGMRV